MPALTLEALFALAALALFIHVLPVPDMQADWSSVLALQKAHDLFRVWNHVGFAADAQDDFCLVFPACAGEVDSRRVSCPGAQSAFPPLAVEGVVWEAGADGFFAPRTLRVVVEC